MNYNYGNKYPTGSSKTWYGIDKRIKQYTANMFNPPSSEYTSDESVNLNNLNDFLDLNLDISLLNDLKPEVKLR